MKHSEKYVLLKPKQDSAEGEFLVVKFGTGSLFEVNCSVIGIWVG